MSNSLNARYAEVLGGGQTIRREAGNCVVVTGAGGGIGLSIVERLIQDGWAVIATDRDDKALAVLHESARRNVSTLTVRAMDVTQRGHIDAVAHELENCGHKVAGLVNVAGILQDVTQLLGMDDVQQRRIWDVNYFGAQQCLQVFAACMAANGGGSIVNITSINELQPLPLHAYAPSKVALGALTRLAAGELGESGIRVNAVAPGFTLTPIFKAKLAGGKRDPDVIEKHTALGRLVRTEEIASAVSFLISDDASAITGVSLPVDAGWLSTAHWMNFRDLAQ